MAVGRRRSPRWRSRRRSRSSRWPGRSASGDWPRRKPARREWALTGPVPPPGDRQIRPEHDQGADDRRDPAAGGEPPGPVRLRAATEQGVSDEAADERSNHAEDCRHEPAHGLTSGEDGPRKQADDEAEDQETDDSHIEVLLWIAG